jgi:hypothetical protein
MVAARAGLLDMHCSNAAVIGALGKRCNRHRQELHRGDERRDGT